MKNVVIYCRVSTKEQAENGLSLITQEKLCREFAKKHDLNIVTPAFIEHGESAKTLVRPTLEKMLEFIGKNKGLIDTLLIYKIDRLSRQTLDYQSIKVLLAKYGISIYSLTENIEDSPSGRMLETIMSAAAQWDNEVRGERAKNGTKEALQQGRWPYAASYGYIQTGGRGKANLIVDNNKATIMKKVFKYLAEGGHTIEDARKYAFKLGMKGKKGSLYEKSTFHRIIRKPIYKGFIKMPSMEIYQKGSFQAIIEPKTFDLVQDIINGKNHNPPIYRKIHPDFPLRGTILCPQCNRKLTANWSKKKYPYYKCSYCKNINLRRQDIHRAFEEFLSHIKLSETIVELTEEAIKLNWEERNKTYEIELKELKSRQVEIAKEQDAIALQNREGILPPRVAKEQLDNLENEYTQIGAQISMHKPTEEVNEELLEYSSYFLKNMCSIWSELEPSSQNELQNFLFSEGLQFDGEKFATNQETFIKEVNHYITIGEVSESESPGTRTQHLLLKRQLL